jgi:hypothetical protein
MLGAAIAVLVPLVARAHVRRREDAARARATAVLARVQDLAADPNDGKEKSVRSDARSST